MDLLWVLIGGKFVRLDPANAVGNTKNQQRHDEMTRAGNTDQMATIDKTFQTTMAM